MPDIYHLFVLLVDFSLSERISGVCYASSSVGQATIRFPYSSITTVSVSYTHLDVYKRQCLFCSCCNFNDCCDFVQMPISSICFFAKDVLPTYYDANKINYVSQGIFRIHLVGLDVYKRQEYIGAFVPYGYEKSDDDKHKLVIDIYAAGIVKEIFRLKLHGMSQDER